MHAIALLIGLVMPLSAAAPSPRVCMVPLGKHDARLLKVAQRGVEFLYGFETTVLERRRLPAKAFYKPRKRYRAEKLLDHLDAIHAQVGATEGCDFMMGFTAVDISTTKGEHRDWGIMGLGSIGGISGVVSTFRLKRRARRRRLMERTVKLVNHELGHVLGAPHIAEDGCLMEDKGGTVKSVDAESGLLCEGSMAAIERTRGFRPPAHERMSWQAILP